MSLTLKQKGSTLPKNGVDFYDNNFLMGSFRCKENQLVKQMTEHFSKSTFAQAKLDRELPGVMSFKCSTKTLNRLGDSFGDLVFINIPTDSIFHSKFNANAIFTRIFITFIE